MRSWISIIILPAVLLLSACCETIISPPPGTVNMYLIESYEPGEGWIMIDVETVQLNDTLLLAYDDLLSYEPAYYTFTLSEKGREVLFNQHIYGKAFAVVIEGTIIYTGFIWPGFYSAGCNWVVIDPLSLSLGDKVSVELGYPGLMEGIEIPDHRNDILLLNAFREEGKLIE